MRDQRYQGRRASHLRLGAVKWVANSEVAPCCEQSFGLVHILPGKTNPAHCHTAAEEIVFMLRGERDVRVGDRHMKVGPGQTLVIPQGVMHEGGTLDRFIEATFAVPTRSEAYKYAAYDGLARLDRRRRTAAAAAA